MLAILLTAIIFFFVSSLFGHLVHWALHQRWSGFLNQKHMTHHLMLYPPSDYLSNTYRQAGVDSTPKFFIIAALPLIITPIVLGYYGVMPISLVITALIVMGTMGFLHNYLHDSFHIRNHFLNHVPLINHLFGRWSRLHYLHHVDMQKNFGIFLFHWDHIFRTYWNKEG